jgi:hypothetical protein
LRGVHRQDNAQVTRGQYGPTRTKRHSNPFDADADADRYTQQDVRRDGARARNSDTPTERHLTMKSGGMASTNTERWIQSAGEYKRQAEKLAAELIEVTRERDELRESLDHIAEIAGPDRILDSERLEKNTRMLEMLMSRAGFQAGVDFEPDTPPEEEDDASDPAKITA